MTTPVEVCLMRIAGTTADRWLTRPGARKRKCRILLTPNADYWSIGGDNGINNWCLQGVSESPNALLPGGWP